MKLSELFKNERPTLSFEVFPPKRDMDAEGVRRAVLSIAGLSPDFISVTYGAAGGASEFTAELAQSVQEKGVTALSHLTCGSSSRERVRQQLQKLRALGIENVLALRGDFPEKSQSGYRYACELVEELREYGGFCVGAACYPEGHVESASQAEDLKYLKQKPR
jgi:methylenetetrahydrofolate reductase (NADPH)